MDRRLLCAAVAAMTCLAGCTSSGEAEPPPELAGRGTTMTKAALTRQDLTAKVSLDGKVALNPVFGLVAPVDGEIRYLDVKAKPGTPTKATHVGGVWAGGRQTRLEVPPGSVFAGRLVADRSKVVAGMPVVSARHGGYGIVADIDSAQAYAIADGRTTVRAQIKSGPGPFDCAVLGTIAALPPGAIPDPPAPEAPARPAPGDPSAATPPPPPPPQEKPEEGTPPSEATGMRLVCTAPPGVKLINGASATLEVITAQVKQVLVAPVEAVAGRQGKGKVDVLGPDGSRRTRDVELGLTDGRVVEIKSGLTGTEELAVPGPNLPPAAEAPASGAPAKGSP